MDDLGHTQSREEEFANSLSHGMALMLAMVAIPTLISSAIEQGEMARILGATVFSASVVLLYFTSTVYHALPASRAKGLLPVARSQRHLSANRWHLHTLHVGRIARSLGLDAVGGDLEPGPDWIGIQGHSGHALRKTLDWALLVYGLAGATSYQATLAGIAGLGDFLAIGRWHFLHGGSCFLCHRPPALQPLPLASLRHCRHSLPLRRRTKICGLMGGRLSNSETLEFVPA